MKKSLLVLLAILSLSVPAAFAAGSSSSTQIVAIVGASVAVTGDLPSSTTIDVSQTTANLGTIRITSNTTGSWTITVSSAKAGKMIGETLLGEYPYTISLGTILNAVSLSTPKVANISSVTGVIDYVLTVQYATAASLNLAADTYKDTITVTVATVN